MSFISTQFETFCTRDKFKPHHCNIHIIISCDQSVFFYKIKLSAVATLGEGEPLQFVVTLSHSVSRIQASGNLSNLINSLSAILKLDGKCLMCIRCKDGG